jgi:hypothetical protein
MTANSCFSTCCMPGIYDSFVSQHFIISSTYAIEQLFFLCRNSCGSLRNFFLWTSVFACVITNKQLYVMWNSVSKEPQPCIWITVHKMEFWIVVLQNLAPNWCLGTVFGSIIIMCYLRSASENIQWYHGMEWSLNHQCIPHTTGLVQNSPV